MLIGRTILQYTIGCVAPFPQEPFSDFSPTYNVAYAYVHAYLFGTRESNVVIKKKGKIINKRKENAASARRSISWIFIWVRLGLFEVAFWRFVKHPTKRPTSVGRALFNFYGVIRHHEDVPPNRHLTRDVCSAKDGSARSMELSNRDEGGLIREREGENIASNSCHLSYLVFAD